MKKLISFIAASSMLVSAVPTTVMAEAVTENVTETAGQIYNAVANGMDGEISVDVTVADGVITDITVVEDNETSGVGDKALEIISKEVVEKQSLAVDSVAGATISSGAIKTAIADALTQAGEDASEWKNREIAVEAADESYDYDVVVAGAGLAGLTAALSAEKAGAKVALIEKQGIVGGTSIFSSGNFLAASEEELIPEVVENWNARNKMQEVNQVNMDLVNNLLAVSPEVLAMYGEIGVEFDYKAESYTMCPVPSEKSIKNSTTIELVDAHVKDKGGEALITSLANALEADGVDIYLNTPATSLIKAEDGSITGIVSETENGTKTFNAKSVILATGDYARNNDLNAEYAPETVGEYTSTAVSNTGDGLVMALDAGAVMHDYQESMSGNFVANPYEMPVAGQPENQFPFSVVLVDREGNRKVSESAGPHAQQVFFIYDDEPDHAWAVMDQEIADKFINMDEFLEKTEAGSPFIQTYKADTIEELAEKIGMDAATLAETVNHYNELCEAGEDTDFGKEADYLSAIEEGPFYAVKEYDSTRGNYGGIITNDKFEVTNADGEAIKGLYAAGIISSGDYFGDYYPGREALSLGAHGGFIAGQNAANAANAE